MDLRHKTLLLMGGGAYAKDILSYKIEKGFRIVSVGRDKETPIARIADKAYYVDTQNINEICNIVKVEHVDGIFVGSSEVNISPAIDVSAKTGATFYVNREQWDIISNKANFKRIAKDSGFPVVPEYQISYPFKKDEIDKLEYPVMIKPTDSSGARGMNACFKAEDFASLYYEALSFSKKKEVIVEKLVTNAEEVFVNYSIQDGKATLAYSFTKFLAKTQRLDRLIPLFHMYPSKFIDEYYEKVDESAKKMIKNLCLQNGTLTLQGFYKDHHFYFFEAGFRMGGAQAYILTDYMWGSNVLRYMINYALTKSMCDDDISKIENARFTYPCCNYYVVLKPGCVDHFEGLETVYTLPGVLNVTQMCSVGEEVLDTNALERIAFRIHVVGKSAEELAHNLVSISSTLRIISTMGEEMQMEPLTFERCLSLINGK